MTTSFIAAEVTFGINGILYIGRESVFTDLGKTAVRLRG